MKRFPLLAALALFAGSSIALANPPPHYSYSGGVPTALLAAGDSANFVGSSHFPTTWGPSFSQPTINVYIIYYNNAAHPWTTAEQTLLVGFLNALSGSQWWSIFRDYPNAKGVSILGQPLVVSTTTVDAEAEGTNLCGGQDSNIVGDNIPPLPSDSNGIYLVAPSWTDVNYNACGGIAGNHSLNGSLSFAVALRQTCAFTITTPNADCPFDFQVGTFSHEVGEALVLGWTSGINEVWDQCSQVTPPLKPLHYSATYLTGAPAAANFHVPSVGDFLIQDEWSREEGGLCTQGQALQTLLTPCNANADCTWSHVCTASGAHCAPATCSDGVQNGYESDTDCGSTCGTGGFTSGGNTYLAGNCASGKKCVTGLDCASGICTASVCN